MGRADPGAEAKRSAERVRARGSSRGQDTPTALPAQLRWRPLGDAVADSFDWSSAIPRVSLISPSSRCATSLERDSLGSTSQPGARAPAVLRTADLCSSDSLGSASKIVQFCRDHLLEPLHPRSRIVGNTRRASRKPKHLELKSFDVAIQRACASTYQLRSRSLVFLPLVAELDRILWQES